MMKNKVRIAVIGLGDFGERHIRTFLNIQDAELAAVVSRSEDRGKKIAKKYKIKKSFTECQTMLDSVEVDAVDIVTEESRHFKSAMCALQRNKHIFVEKPISDKSIEAQKMVDEAKRRNLIFFPGHILRFSLPYCSINEKIEAGEMGKILSVFSRRNVRKSHQADCSRLSLFLSSAIHDIDVVSWYVKKRVTSVYARAIHSTRNKDDGWWAMINFEGGAIGVVETIWLLPDVHPCRIEEEVEVIGTKCVARHQMPDRALVFLNEKENFAPDLSNCPELRGEIGGALKAELSYFVECVKKEEKPMVITAEESVYSLKIAGKILESAEKNREIFLEGER